MAGDAKVTDIKCLNYTEGTIHYKLSFEEEYKPLPLHKTKSLTQHKDVNEIQIPKHLQELKLTIPKDYHSFYDALPTVK